MLGFGRQDGFCPEQGLRAVVGVADPDGRCGGEHAEATGQEEKWGTREGWAVGRAGPSGGLPPKDCVGWEASFRSPGLGTFGGVACGQLPRPAWPPTQQLPELGQLVSCKEVLEPVPGAALHPEASVLIQPRGDAGVWGALSTRPCLPLAQLPSVPRPLGPG